MSFEWGNVTDDALIEEVRRRGFTIRDAQISSRRKWVGLSDEDCEELLDSNDWGGSLIYAVEAKLKEKNT